MKRLCTILCVFAVVTTAGGCVGPSKLRRGLDEHCNQLYVDNPLLAQCLSPLMLVGEGAAATADALFVNPVFWWKDALEGEGTPYYYRNPTKKVATDDE
ncbi:MAG: hypothetical protein AAF581_05740 [Planctomycetota bacterium]